MFRGHVRPRIAILSAYPADFVSFSGGVETATAGLLEGLRAYQDEFEFHVVSLSKELRRDLQVEREGFMFHFLSLPYSWQRPRLPFWSLRTLTEIRRIAPDLIHCQDNMAMAIAAIWSGRSRLFTIHGLKRHEASKRIGWERWSATADAWLEPYVHRHFDDFICISDYARRVGANGNHTHLIPNAVRSALFDVRREALSNSPMLLFVGLLSPLKRPTDLILVHQDLRTVFPNLQTVFCGDAENHRYMSALQAMAGDGIDFRGRVDLTVLMDLLSKAVALVLPSAQENAPIVITEAMAAGVPVVATCVGGVPQIVRDGDTGFLYEAGDLYGLKSALIRLLTEIPMACTMGQVARQEALLRYHVSIIASQTAQVYQRVIREHDARL